MVSTYTLGYRPHVHRDTVTTDQDSKTVILRQRLEALRRDKKQNFDKAERLMKPELVTIGTGHNLQGKGTPG
jgi:hypothetical protein